MDALKSLKKKVKPDYTICFSELVADMLESLEVTKAELARRLETSPQALSKMFNGSRPATVDTAIKIAHALNEDPNVFVYWATKEEVARSYVKNKIDVTKVEKLFSKAI